jgi:hypothetical protein
MGIGSKIDIAKLSNRTDTVVVGNTVKTVSSTPTSSGSSYSGSSSTSKSGSTKITLTDGTTSTLHYGTTSNDTEVKYTSGGQTYTYNKDGTKNIISDVNNPSNAGTTTKPTNVIVAEQKLSTGQNLTASDVLALSRYTGKDANELAVTTTLYTSATRKIQSGQSLTAGESLAISRLSNQNQADVAKSAIDYNVATKKIKETKPLTAQDTMSFLRLGGSFTSQDADKLVSDVEKYNQSAIIYNKSNFSKDEVKTNDYFDLMRKNQYDMQLKAWEKQEKERLAFQKKFETDDKYIVARIIQQELSEAEMMKEKSGQKAKQYEAQSIMSFGSGIWAKDASKVFEGVKDWGKSKFYQGLNYIDTFAVATGKYSFEEHMKYQEAPVKYVGIQALKIGVGASVGYGMTALSASGVVGATLTKTIGLVAFPTIAYTSYDKISKSDEKLYTSIRIVGDIAPYALGGALGAKTALSAGNLPQPDLYPRLTYEKFNVKDLQTGKESTLYRGIGWKQNYVDFPESATWKQVLTGKVQPNSFVVQGGQIVGYGQGQVGILGKYPTLSYQYGDVTTLTSPTHLKLIQNMKFGTAKTAQSLPDEYVFIKSLAGNEKQKLADIMRIVEDRGTSYVKPKFYDDKMSRNVRSFVNPEQNVDVFLGEVKGKVVNVLGKQASVTYGSATITPQTRPLYAKQIGASGDFDIMLFKDDKFTSDFAVKTSSKLNWFGEKTFVDKNSPFLIQTKIADANHLGDLHPVYSNYAPQGFVKPQESFFGYPFNQKVTTVEGMNVMRLSEANLRYASSSFTPRIRDGNVYFAPEEHRGKDVVRLMTTTKQLLEQKGLSVIDSARLKKWFPQSFFEQNIAQNQLHLQLAH